MFFKKVNLKDEKEINHLYLNAKPASKFYASLFH